MKLTRSDGLTAFRERGEREGRLPQTPSAPGESPVESFSDGSSTLPTSTSVNIWFSDKKSENQIFFVKNIFADIIFIALIVEHESRPRRPETDRLPTNGFFCRKNFRKIKKIKILLTSPYFKKKLNKISSDLTNPLLKVCRCRFVFREIFVGYDE